MAESAIPLKLEDGTLIRHKMAGYEGRIEGTTGIKTCFTQGGKSLDQSNSKQLFQYRVVVQGESMRRIAPAEDLEILETATQVVCARCQFSFKTKPGLADKPGGRCGCGGWICPSCLDCREADDEARCLKQGRRLARKLSSEKKIRNGLTRG